MAPILLIWQLPQILLGIMVRIVSGARFMRRLGPSMVFAWRSGSGLSLGPFCFVPLKASERMIRHECGHSIQSRKLGPLYLAVIGLPSFAWAVLRRIGFFRDASYFSFFTEKWAENEAETLF